MTEGFVFRGCRFGAHWDKRYGYGPRVEIPNAKGANLRRKVKHLTQRDSISVSLGEKLRKVNSITSGQANYYRYCVGAGRVFVALHWHIGLRLYCWIHKKRPKATPSELRGSKQPSRRRATRRVWSEGSTEQQVLCWTPVERYRLALMDKPDFAMSSGEPDAQTKGARPVRRVAMRDLPPQCGKARIAYSFHLRSAAAGASFPLPSSSPSRQ